MSLATHHNDASMTTATATPAPDHIGWFTRIAHETARLTGKPASFLIAAGLIIAWGVSGPLFNYSDTWQLIINTSTTIITFLMVFLIQSTQNRDTLALQIKLAELICVVQGAKDRYATIEDLSEEQLEALKKQFRARAENGASGDAKPRGA